MAVGALFTVAIVLAGAALAPGQTPQSFFDLGAHLVLDFRGTSEFRNKRIEFQRLDAGSYLVKSAGDQSPSEDRLQLERGHVYWVLGSSAERWLVLRNPLKEGDHWQHSLRGWRQTYRVSSVDLTVSVPAGRFRHCAEVTISWTAHEHDLQGPQKKVLFLAPNLGVIKQEYWSNGVLEHEEVLTGFRKQ